MVLFATIANLLRALSSQGCEPFWLIWLSLSLGPPDGWPHGPHCCRWIWESVASLLVDLKAVTTREPPGPRQIVSSPDFSFVLPAPVRLPRNPPPPQPPPLIGATDHWPDRTSSPMPILHRWLDLLPPSSTLAGTRIPSGHRRCIFTAIGRWRQTALWRQRHWRGSALFLVSADPRWKQCNTEAGNTDSSNNNNYVVGRLFPSSDTSSIFCFPVWTISGTNWAVFLHGALTF